MVDRSMRGRPRPVARAWISSKVCALEHGDICCYRLLDSTPDIELISDLDPDGADALLRAVLDQPGARGGRNDLSPGSCGPPWVGHCRCSCSIGRCNRHSGTGRTVVPAPWFCVARIDAPIEAFAGLRTVWSSRLFCKPGPV